MFHVIRKRCLSRRHLFLTFIIVTTLSIFYICYQALSVLKLGKELSEEYVRKTSNPRLYQKADFPVQLYPLNENVVYANEEVDNASAHAVNKNVNEDHGIRIRGLLVKHIKNYIPNSRGNFVCTKSTQEIPYNRVNNDYCDCEDGTDEPSTSACLHGRFYCERQPRSKEVFIVSSRVNDGICDCCDGSDEWGNVQVPSHTRINEEYEAKLGIDQTPCRNRC